MRAAIAEQELAAVGRSLGDAQRARRAAGAADILDDHLLPEHLGEPLREQPPDQVDRELRSRVKMVTYGLAYGLSAFGLAQGIGIAPDEAKAMMDAYFERFGKVKAYLERTVAEGRERGYVATLLGRRRYLPELKSGNPNLRSFGERMATNAPIQGTAADLIKIAMVRMARQLASRGLRSRMLLQVHDELLFEAPEDELPALEALAVEIMESALELTVPLKVDVKAGADWAAV